MSKMKELKNLQSLQNEMDSAVVEISSDDFIEWNITVLQTKQMHC